MRYWIKLYTEILHDPKMGRLSDAQFRTCICLFAMAGTVDKDGELPPEEDIAWQLRRSPAELHSDLETLAAVGIIEYRDDAWFVRKWQERQSRAPSAAREKVLQRVHDYRQRERNESVTTLHPQVKRGVTPPETETETETEKNRLGVVIERGADAPAPAARPKARHPAPPVEGMDHPAVVVYRDIVHLTPNVQARKLIAESVTDLPRWQATVENWLAHSWNPRNVPGMLDAYRTGNGTGPPQAGREHPAITAMKMVQAEREKERAQHGHGS